MINPSAPGWIDKFFSRTTDLPVYKDSHSFYNAVRDTGFIYGHVTGFKSILPDELMQWSTEEITKVALLDVLYTLYRLKTNNSRPESFINAAITFYKQMPAEGFSINPFKKMLRGEPAASKQLEEILDIRVKTNDNIISRNFSHILINALLFMDVLAFERCLQEDHYQKDYLVKLEVAVTGLVAIALETKSTPTEYDKLLIKLFEASVRYIKFAEVKIDDIKNLDLPYFTFTTEKLYLLDMAVMALWTETPAPRRETDFIYQLGEKLGLEEANTTESIADFDVFLKLNRKNIPYFRYSNPVRHFYENAAQNVTLLIKRNKKRLIKEISNNGELVVLLTHSTHRALDKKEKKKIKKQLLEICKTIPSLTIFLLPGGSLLLPLLIKFIPQLLPTVFNENLEEDNN